MSEYNQVKGINKDLCIECGECLEVCSMGCFDDMDFSLCGACGMCSDECPVGAIVFSDSVEAGLMTAYAHGPR